MKKTILTIIIIILPIILAGIFFIFKKTVSPELPTDITIDKQQEKIQEKKNTTIKKGELPVDLIGGKTMWISDENVSRPEICIIDNIAYLMIRHSIPGKFTNQKNNEAVLKAFLINSKGEWEDITKINFGTKNFILYSIDETEGRMTDPQLLCDKDGFIFAFESLLKEGGIPKKQLVIRRLSPKGAIVAQKILFQDVSNLKTTIYKSDDPGIALQNGTLWTWMVGIEQPSRKVDSFRLYGLNPNTLTITTQDNNGSPLKIANPKKAPFSGMMEYKNNYYYIFTSPKETNGNNFSQNGLVQYQYNTQWKLLGFREINHPFGTDKPLYITGKTQWNGFDIWGFTVQPSYIETYYPSGRQKLQPNQQVNNLGRAYIMFENRHQDTKFFFVSANDTLGKEDDTRHTELAVWNNYLYIGYFHVSNPSYTIIRRFQLKNFK